jgi:cytochrome c-type biogenesis protein CcmH
MNPLSHLVSRNNLHLWLIGLLLVVISALALPVLAQDSTVTDDDVNDIASRLYCPVCENIPLDTCGTAACIQWRAEIRAQLEAGQTEEQVVNDFVQRFGERVVGTPQDPMLRALSLVTPWLLGALALIVAISTLLRWRQRRTTVSASDGAASANGGHGDDDYRTRLEADLLTRR